MKEFTASLQNMISRGIRPDDRMVRNSGYATKCQNARITKVEDNYRLSTFTPITLSPTSTQLTAAGITISHPFPQVFKGREVSLLMTQTKAYTWSIGSGSPLSEISTYDGYNVGNSKSIVSGNSWHFTDFGGVYALFNGSCVVFKSNRLSMFTGGSNKLLVVDNVTINTGCDFRGRMILGGFSSSDFWNSSWSSYISSLFSLGFSLASPTAPGSNWVWWSQIGSGAFFLFYKDDEVLGLIDDNDNDVFTTTNSMLMETIERNEMGFMPMNWQGTVLRVLGLGKAVMVYGDGGISVMPMVGSTFGLADLLRVGVASRSAVGGNGMEHVFVDDTGWLYRIGIDLIPHRLGYRDQFENMIGNDITISYDPMDDEYHISDSSVNYVLTRDNRLYESTYLVTSSVVDSGDTIGIYDRPGDSDDGYFMLVSDSFDLGVRATKTIERIVISATNTATVSVAIDWRNRTRDNWTRTSYYNANYEGVAYIMVKGLEFRIIVRCTDYTKIDLDNIHIQFKVDDRRIIRGTYALEASGR